MTRQHWARLGTTLLTLGLLASSAYAADHSEAPGAAADPAADIADFYAFHTDGGKLILISTFAGLGSSEDGGVYDTDVLYNFHIDNDGDNVPDVDIRVRFGENASGAFGVQVLNAPGEDGPVVGPIGEDVTGAGGTVVNAGRFDDPFFFDLVGFTETLDTGTLAFTGADAVAGLSVTAIVLSVDLAAASGGSDSIQVWHTTSRK